MRRGLVIVVAAAAAFVFAGRASASPVWSGQCGIVSAPTVWGEYGWPSLLPILAKPGTLLAVTSGSDYPAQARAAGAATYYFDLHMANRVGTPTKPADPATIAAQAQKEYTYSVGQTGGCSTPLVVENELSGAGLTTPWTANNTQYRADVLALLQKLHALGAHPVLLVNSVPYTSGDALDWWQAVAGVADIVREVYVPAPTVWKAGPLLGNRLLRQRYRKALADFTSIGIPPNRLGIMISFSTAAGGGGRSGLQPTSAWLQVVKWEALAAKQVAADTGAGSVFSWGFQMWSAAETDPAKPQAACVWLWARTQSLCNAPQQLGKSFDASLTEGQIVLEPGTFCSITGGGSITVRELRALQVLTGDRDAAMSALVERLTESRWTTVTNAQVLAAEKTVIADSFKGSRAAYLSALRAAHASPAIARAALADELRRAALEAKLAVGTPTSADIQTFYSTYPQLLVRRVTAAAPAPGWLGGAKAGYALAEVAPESLFGLPAGKKATVSTLAGPVTLKPVGAAFPLGALTLSAARPAITAALRSFARSQAFETWTIGKQKALESRMTCLRDEFPEPAAVDLTNDLPFLRIG